MRSTASGCSYAFHGKRMFPEIFVAERTTAELAGLLGQSPEAVAQMPPAELVKAVAKSAGYNAFVQQKIAAGQLASSQIGNMYTASIFMGLMSCLETHLAAGHDLAGQQIGFCAYGSGSKSKVFAGTIRPGYREVVGQFGVFAGLAGRQAIGLDDYEHLHDKTLTQPISPHSGQFVLASIATEPATLRGARHYVRA